MSDTFHLSITQINQGLATIGQRGAMNELQKLALRSNGVPQVCFRDGDCFTVDERAQGMGLEVWVMLGDIPISSHGPESPDALSSAGMVVLALHAARFQIIVDKSLEDGSFLDMVSQKAAPAAPGPTSRAECGGMVQPAVDLKNGRAWSECNACGKTFAKGLAGLCSQVSAPQARALPSATGTIGHTRVPGMGPR